MKLMAVLLCAAAAFAELPPKQTVTVALTTTPTADAAKEITGLVKFVAQLPDASYNEALNSLSLTGRQHQLELATWLVHATEKSAANDTYAVQPDMPYPDHQPVARVHYLRSSDPLNTQEIITIARVVGEIQFIHGLSQPPMIAFRGTAAQAELGEWLATNLDVPAGKGQKVFQLPALPNGDEEMVQIIFLDPAIRPAAQRALREKIRLTTNTRTIFDKVSPPAIVIRGNAALLAQVQQLMNQN